MTMILLPTDVDFAGMPEWAQVLLLIVYGLAFAVSLGIIITGLTKP